MRICGSRAFGRWGFGGFPCLKVERLTAIQIEWTEWADISRVHRRCFHPSSQQHCDQNKNNTNMASTTASLGGMQNQQWATDNSAYGRKMLEKMGWADGQGLGKDMQGDKTFVRVKKRENNLGLGQEATSCTKAGGPNGVANRVDAAAGMKGWKQTNDNFAGVLASLGATYGSEHKKKKKKRDKKKRKRAAENGSGDGDEESSGSDNGAGGAVAHAEVAFSSRKKHIRNKNLTRMSAHEISCLLGGAPSSTPAAATASRPKKKHKKDKKKKKKQRCRGRATGR